MVLRTFYFEFICLLTRFVLSIGSYFISLLDGYGIFIVYLCSFVYRTCFYGSWLISFLVHNWIERGYGRRDYCTCSHSGTCLFSNFATFVETFVFS